MFNLKNLKIVKDLKSISPKLKWLMFSQVQDYKINSNYIDLICNDQDKDVSSDNQRLEAMVKEMLVKEFSPEVKKLKSYNLIVDAVIHNLKKKQNSLVDED